VLEALVITLVGYLSGALPFGYWVAKQWKGIDIREHGSGSTGATNVWRCVSKEAGVAVFFLDLLKGLAPVVLARYLDEGGLVQAWSAYPHVVPFLVALAALIGHSKSVFLGMQGGKSAATGLGTLFALNPLGGLFTFLTWLLVVKIGRIVSVASILAVFMCGVYFYLLKSPPVFVLYCILGFLYVTYRHKANIKRLLEGTEPKLGDKPKEQGPTEPGTQSS